MKGVYVLLIELVASRSIKIGALWRALFKKGYYVYVGSAQNNLEKRVLRHRSKSKKMHWHIDYLLKSDVSKLREVFYKTRGKVEECKIAGKIASNSTGMKRFGCSDCKCYSHLFMLKDPKLLSKINMNKFDFKMI